LVAERERQWLDVGDPRFVIGHALDLLSAAVALDMTADEIAQVTKPSDAVTGSEG
jgi:hypothetical protein